MRITRTGTYVITAAAVALFVFLSLAFDSLTRFSLRGPWLSQVNERGETAFIDGVFWTYWSVTRHMRGKGDGAWYGHRSP
jgi:hypothetical protein